MLYFKDVNNVLWPATTGPLHRLELDRVCLGEHVVLFVGSEPHAEAVLAALATFPAGRVTSRVIELRIFAGEAQARSIGNPAVYAARSVVL